MTKVLLDPSIMSFYLSFIGIVGMIGVKSMVTRRGKTLWFSRYFDRLNTKISKTYLSIKRFISYFNRKSAVALVQWIAYHILSWGHELYMWIYKKAHSHSHSKRVIDMVRGRGEIKSNSGSSFYLKKISKDGESDDEVVR